MSVIEGVNTMQTNATTGAGLGYEVSRAEAQISSALGLSDDFSASTATTGRVMVGGSVSGTIEATGDNDWIAVNLVAGSRYTLNLKGASSGSGTLADPVIDSIRDASGNSLLGGYADDGGTGYDSLLSFTPTTSGTFYVVARSVNNTGTGTYILTASTPTGSADDFSADVATTGRVAVGGSRTGVLEASGDTDWIGVNLTAGSRYTFNLKGASSGVGTLNDPVIDSIRDASGNTLPNSSADDGGMGLDSLLSFTPTTSGMFYVVARSYGSDTGSYVLSADAATTTPPISTTAATLSIAASSAYQSEGNSGSTPFTFTVTRTGTSTGAASAAWAVTGSGPNPANGTDFVGGALPSGTVNFAAGQTTATVTVNVSGDLTAETDDGFTIALSNPVGATLGTSTVATTLNQSASGGVGVTQNDYILAGASGTFTVNYNNYSIPDQVDVSVNGQKIVGTAGQVSNTGTLTIPTSTALRAGDVVSVIMTGTDSGTAWDYTANYTGGAQLANYVVAGTILNDDQGSVTPPSSGRIIGTSANDTLQGTTGNDVVDGLGGVDTFVCSGNRASYTVNRSFGGYTITGPEGVDTLTNVERIRFADSKLGLDVSGNLGSVVKLLGAVFGAASVGRADFVGIGLNYMDNGMSYASLGALALNAAGKSTPTDIVNLLWFNVVGSPASAAQAQPYVAMLNNGMSSGDLVVLAADTAINQANIGLVGLEQTGVAYI